MAEECGAAAVWLADHGFDWARALVHRLESGPGPSFRPAPDRWETGTCSCSLAVGVALVDFAQLPGGVTEDGTELGQIHEPLLLLPFIAACAARLQVGVTIHADDVPWAAFSHRSAYLLQEDIDLRARSSIFVKRSSDVQGRKISAGASKRISKDLYQHLNSLALLMTVPATRASEARAGANSSDND